LCEQPALPDGSEGREDEKKTNLYLLTGEKRSGFDQLTPNEVTIQE